MPTSTSWQLERDAAERYQAVVVPAILGPFARALVDHAALRPGETVLDVGCGTGAAALYAAKRVGPTGRVLGADLNRGMLDVARALSEAEAEGQPVEWREADVRQLPFEPGTIDCVVAAQVLQFLPGRAEALAEIRRVVAPNGRVAISAWSPVAENPYFAALVEAMDRHLGADVAAGLGAAFALGEPAAIPEALSAAGFVDVSPRLVELELVLPPLEEFVPGHVAASPMAGGFAAAAPAVRARVVEEVVARLGSDRVVFRSHAVVARGEGGAR